MMRRIKVLACALAGMALLGGCSTVDHVTATVKAQSRSIATQVAGQPSPSASPSAPVSSCGGGKQSARYLGLSVNGFTPDKDALTGTEQKTGITPNVVSMYYNIDTEFIFSDIAWLCSRGAFSLIELDTDNMSLQDLVAGKDDAVLSREALRLSTVETPVAIDFDHEFNGTWYDWGYTHADPAEFVAAWRHVVDVFRANGATNVTWVWNPNVDLSSTTPDLKAWYPGDSYVTWVGLDGYFQSQSDTFASVFDSTMSQVRAFTRKQFFIVETGANPASGRARAIGSLYQGAAAAPDLLGFIWFDYNKYSGHDWYIDHDPAAIAALRAGAAAYQK